MRFCLITGLLCSIASAIAGCTMHNVTFEPIMPIKVPPTSQSTAISGNIEEWTRLLEQARLPHHTARQRFELIRQAGHAMRSQLGSDDYVLLGEVHGGGNAYSNMETLKATLCQKAATAGGDVVLIFRIGVEDRPYVYSTPGYSNTTIQYSGLGQGTATANTTYTPSQTFSGTMHFPFANGLVFKYAPGSERRRDKMAALNDAQLEQVLSGLQAAKNNPAMTWDEFVKQSDRLVENARTQQP